MPDTREQLESDIRDAQRSRNQEKLDALRFLKSKIQQVEVDERKTLDETGVLEVIARQVKERRGSAPGMLLGAPGGKGGSTAAATRSPPPSWEYEPDEKRIYNRRSRIWEWAR